MVWGLRNEKGAVSTEEMGRAGSRFGEMGDQCLCRPMPLGVGVWSSGRSQRRR